MWLFQNFTSLYWSKGEKKYDHLDWSWKNSGDKKQQRFNSQVPSILYLRFSYSIDEGTPFQQHFLVAEGILSWVSYFQPQINEPGILVVSPVTAIFCFYTIILLVLLRISSSFLSNHIPDIISFHIWLI